MQFIAYFIIPFFLSLSITPLVRYWATKKGLIAYPRPDRWHKKPTALFGGISIYLATLLTALIFGLINKDSAALFSGGTFLFIIGLLDDKFHFTPYVKLFMQIVAGCIAVFLGTTIGLPVHMTLAIPLTLLWIVGITNAFNLLDNIDGLAAGICAISSLMVFLSSSFISPNPLGIFGLVLCAAALGFLPYNFNPAKIFMGDSGSMFLGFCLAIISISSTTSHISNFFITLFVPVLILSIPIFDTIFVMFSRRLQGRSIFSGGRDHTSHRLVTLGLSPRKTVILLYVISSVFGLIAFWSSKTNLFIISAIGFLAFVVLLFLGIFLYEVTLREKGESSKNEIKKINNNKTVLNSILLHKRRIIEVFLDFIFICIAYYSAYFLRFEGPLLANNLHLLQQSILWIILIKMSVFFLFGLYRGVWKYIGISDSINIFKAVSVGSLVLVIFLTLTVRFKDYSRAVFIIDWLILLFLIIGSRFLFRIIDEFFSRIQNGRKRIFIFGAGDAGEMVIREIKRNRSLRYNPVGFIDDDRIKIGNKIHGVPVLGSRDQLKDLIRYYSISEVIIAMPSMSEEVSKEIEKICRDSNVLYRSIRGILD
ncbi:MAG: hypothetical protein DRP74_03540 [Candidatus Omnitrophota bacterium]|nr:MAG: hypothetical protein DRP74_03540 [Candidatus Omnitrophota bacterium]